MSYLPTLAGDMKLYLWYANRLHAARCCGTMLHAAYCRFSIPQRTAALAIPIPLISPPTELLLRVCATGTRQRTTQLQQPKACCPASSPEGRRRRDGRDFRYHSSAT